MARGLIQRFVPALSLLVVACSGGSPHAAPAISAPSAIPTATTTATARLTLTIPSKGILTRRRAPLYISPNTAQAVVIVNGGAPQNYSLSTTGPNCQTVPGGAACVLNVAAPIGPSDTFQIALEDGSSNVLSAGSFTTAIAEGVSNVTLPLVLGGVPKTLDITSSGLLGAFFSIGGGTQTSTLVTTVKDAHGDILIGNEPFVNAAGAATPITITSANGSSILYATAPFGGAFGAAAGSVAMNAASDAIEMVFTGSGVPPGYDTLTYAPTGVTSVTYGNNTPLIGIGVVWHAPFVPLTIAPIAADVAGVSGAPHSAVVTDGVSHLAVVGGSSCTVPALPASVTSIPSIAVDGGASAADGTIYTVIGAAATPETDLVNYSLAAVNSGTCLQTNIVNYSPTLAVGGIVRATTGNIVYFAANATQSGIFPPTLEFATSTAPSTLAGGPVFNNPVGALALRGPQGHVFTCGNLNGASNIVLEEYQLPFVGAPTPSSGASASTGSGQTASCAGVAIDGSDGRLVLADIGSTVATRYATNQVSAQANIGLTGTTVVGTQTTDFQSAATGNWHQAEAFFVNASDGIEVFNQNPAIVQQTIISLTFSGLSSTITSGGVEAISYGDDSRLWITLSSGYVVALPTY
jgi:hypothetical protein